LKEVVRDLENLKADLRALETIKVQYAERDAAQTQRQAHNKILTNQLMVRKSTINNPNYTNLMNSKLIDSVSVPKRSSRKSESHTSKSKKALGGSTKFCRSGTEN
jgi:hypothetical protein